MDFTSHHSFLRVRRDQFRQNCKKTHPTIYSHAAVDALVSIHKSNEPDGEKGVPSDDELEYTVTGQDDSNSFR
jgi:hypothetical protein